MNHEEKLPVRVVRSEPISKGKKPGRIPPKYFLETEEEFSQRQRSLIQEVDHVQKYFQESFQKYPQIPHVSKVQLVEKAIAKSHRPTYLFYKDTCPIIGVGNLGQLFVRTELKRLHYLKDKIEQEPPAETTKDKWKANISAVSNFNPFTEDDRLKGETPESLIELLEHDGRSTIKVKLFDFFDSKANLTTRKGFISLINRFGLSPDEIGESVGLEIWKIEEIDIESLRVLATFPAIQELSLFPRYKVIQPSKKQTTSSVLIPTPEPREYPVVGLLDTGIPENHFLSPWVIQSNNFVDPGLSNRFHGCTVGSLLVMAHYFNDSLDIDNDFLKILNVEILGNTDNDYGGVDEVFEDELIRRIEYYFRDSGSFPRIWNMSLGFPETCEFKRFSDLAIFLDKLQDKHNLLFVLPSGNYNKKKFRIWPPKTGDIGIQQINENDPNLPPDYLSKPADCIRAITVGAIACDEKKTSTKTFYICRV